MSNDSEAGSPLTPGSTSKPTHSEEWTLYVLAARMPARSTLVPEYDDITHVYARDEDHAKLRAKPWLMRHQQLLSLKVNAFPDGTTLRERRLPGSITIEVPDEENSDGK